MLVIYDKTNAYIYLLGDGYENPTELGYMNITIPEGKMLQGIDIASEEHKPVFVDIPKTEIELLREEVKEIKEQNQALLDGINYATGNNESEVW